MQIVAWYAYIDIVCGVKPGKSAATPTPTGMKPLKFLGSSRDDLCAMPDSVRHDIGLELMRVQFSRRKAEYLIGAAQKIVAGELDLKRLATAPPEEAEAGLVAVLHMLIVIDGGRRGLLGHACLFQPVFSRTAAVVMWENASRRARCKVTCTTPRPCGMFGPLA